MPKSPFERLQPFDKEKKLWRIVVETPCGTGAKFKFEPELGLFTLSTTLPDGMTFPLDFGFLPGTVGDDGDPLDVLLLGDQPTFCGCVVPARLIGVIAAEQTSRDGETERNDRIVAVADSSRRYADHHSLKDLGKQWVKDLENFFIAYNRGKGGKFKVLDTLQAKAAEKAARDGMTMAKKNVKRKK
jgi:inorganic pyrophosphatase